jgi:hypothetical protein
VADVLAQPVYKTVIDSRGSIEKNHGGIIALGIEEYIGTVSSGRAIVPIVAGIRLIEPGKSNAHPRPDVSALELM